jgi:hypothetical protein
MKMTNQECENNRRKRIKWYLDNCSDLSPDDVASMLQTLDPPQPEQPEPDVAAMNEAMNDFRDGRSKPVQDVIDELKAEPVADQQTGEDQDMIRELRRRINVLTIEKQRLQNRLDLGTDGEPVVTAEAGEAKPIVTQEMLDKLANHPTIQWRLQNVYDKLRRQETQTKEKTNE